MALFDFPLHSVRWRAGDYVMMTFVTLKHAFEATGPIQSSKHSQCTAGCFMVLLFGSSGQSRWNVMVKFKQ